MLDCEALTRRHVSIKVERVVCPSSFQNHIPAKVTLLIRLRAFHRFNILSNRVNKVVKYISVYYLRPLLQVSPHPLVAESRGMITICLTTIENAMSTSCHAHESWKASRKKNEVYNFIME